MLKTRSAREAGLTMVEVVIAAIILTAIVGMSSWLVWSASNHITTAEVTVQLEMNAREFLTVITKELHQSRMIKVLEVDTKSPIPCDGKAIDIALPTPGTAKPFTAWDPLDLDPDPEHNKFDGIRFRTTGQSMELTAVDSNGLVNGKAPPVAMPNSANADLNGTQMLDSNGKPMVDSNGNPKFYDNFNLAQFKLLQAANAPVWLYEVQYWWEIDDQVAGFKGGSASAEGKVGPGPNGLIPDGLDNNDNGVIDEGVIKKMETWYRSDGTIERRTVSTILRDVTYFKMWVPINPSWVICEPGQNPKLATSYKFSPADPVNRFNSGAEQNVVISLTVSKADPRHPKLANMNIVKSFTTTIDLRN